MWNVFEARWEIAGASSAAVERRALSSLGTCAAACAAASFIELSREISGYNIHRKVRLNVEEESVGGNALHNPENPVKPRVSSELTKIRTPNRDPVCIADYGCYFLSKSPFSKLRSFEEARSFVSKYSRSKF